MERSKRQKQESGRQFLGLNFDAMQDAQSPSVREILNALDQWAPRSLQASYDNSGHLVGLPNAEVTKAIVALDCTEALIGEAVEVGAQAVIVHHPIIFKGLKRLTGSGPIERTVMAALKHDIAILAIHTNLDHVHTGVSQHLAQCIGVDPATLQILQPMRDQLYSLTFYTPEDHADAVETAVFAAGAGHVGNYDECAFRTEGEGSFRPLAGSNPFSGTLGEQHRVAERRTEVVVPKWRLAAVQAAMQAAHPYEEVAHNIVALANAHQQVGAGMVGNLPEPMELMAFLDQAKSALSAPLIRHTAPTGRPIRRVAVCGGSGSFLLEDAVASGADLYLTADFKYHEFQEADGRIVIADVGHFESEWRTGEIITSYLTEHFKDKFPNFAVHLARENHNPVHYR
jgi:dinuclear metal center YbgI/SA1388 family protein